MKTEKIWIAGIIAAAWLATVYMLGEMALLLLCIPTLAILLFI